MWIDVELSLLGVPFRELGKGMHLDCVEKQNQQVVYPHIEIDL